MTTYEVKIINEEENIDVVLNCNDDQIILDAAEDDGLELPYSCRAGACSSCAGKLIEGEVDQSDQSFLTDEQIDAQFILTCVAIPKSNCVIMSHAEEDLF